MIPEPLYRQILDVLPIACVDVVLRVESEGGQCLLVRRANEPLQGEWWVVGGRLLHGESAVDAAIRKTTEEVGVTLAPGDLRFLGYYEDRYKRNAFGPSDLYHTLALVFEATLPTLPPVQLDHQSDAWKLSPSLPDRLRIEPPTVRS